MPALTRYASQPNPVGHSPLPFLWTLVPIGMKPNGWAAVLAAAAAPSGGGGGMADADALAGGLLGQRAVMKPTWPAPTK